MNFKELITAADNGNVDAQIEVGRAYELGNAPDGINYDLCYKYYRMAAEQGDALGENNLGWCYEKGYGVKQNYQEALAWYEKSAEKGNGYGLSNAAHMYMSELGVECDHEKVLRYTTLGAEKGVPVCMYNLGFWYLIGQSVNQDKEKAQQLIAAAAAKGHPGAKKMMEDCNGDLSQLELVERDTTETQRGVEAFNNGNIEEGLAIVHSEVDKGFPDAMLLFAKMINNITQGEQYTIMHHPELNRYTLCIIDPNGKPEANGFPALKSVIKLPENVWMEDPDNFVWHYIEEAAKFGDEEANKILILNGKTQPIPPTSSSESSDGGNNGCMTTPLIHQLYTKKSLIVGLVASIISTIIATVLSLFWSNLFVILLIAGCIVGFAVRLTGKRHDKRLGAIGGVFSAIACGLSVLSFCMINNSNVIDTVADGTWISILIAVAIGTYQSQNNEFIDDPK